VPIACEDSLGSTASFLYCHTCIYYEDNILNSKLHVHKDTRTKGQKARDALKNLPKNRKRMRY
jgi:hypothetical protein